MKVRAFLGAAAALAALGLGGWVAANQWRYQTLGGIEVRRHGLTGAIQVRQGGVWRDSGSDLRAPAIPADVLKTVQIRDFQFGDEQLLAFRAVTAPGVAVKGRLAVKVTVRDSLGRIVSLRGDKSLRLTVDWPAGAATSVAINATRDRPAANQTLSVSLESINDQGN